MAETQKTKWGFRLSVFGSVLSVLNAVFAALFAIYQWSDARRESRINLAIEISRTYFKDTSDATTNKIHAWALGYETSLDDAIVVLQSANFLDYVAFLANNEMINGEYLAPNVKCEMRFALSSAKRISARFPNYKDVKYPQLENFRSGFSCPQIVAQPHSN